MTRVEREGSVQSDVDHILRPGVEDNEVSNGGHGGYQSVLDCGDDEGVQQALSLGEGRILLVVRELRVWGVELTKTEEKR